MLMIRKFLLLSAIAVSLAPVVYAEDSEWGFDALMAALSEHPVFSADFIELRSSFFLARPIELKGRIEFDADRRMEKVIFEPFSERIVIDDEAVVIHRVNEEGKAATTKTTRYALANYPFLSKAVRGVSNIFAGDRTLLEELYEWDLKGDRDAWSLVLRPDNERLAEFITAITVRGSGGVINYIHSQEADGDESELALSNRTEIPRSATNVE
ncbi:MAG: outer membrane lipoprotein carrier protein LolA [Proteobacteria bacterium]|nr:MAG: outer membrane lipoprotein carrier protein LolA [Pseudomonadota bacterium]